ncbi:MAG: histidine phosphatase family protein [Candidatus Magasanikbacteria bacterium]|nr:histidine phosphatase family protein [Candidatus Magasanikbacteria bacterium]
MNYFFKRHGKLDLPYQDHNHMPPEILQALGNKTLSPGIDRNFINNFFSDEKIEPLLECAKIFTSPIRRCQETAVFLSEKIFQKTGKKISIIIDENLREVDFNLEKIKQKNNYSAQSIFDVNALVLEAIFLGEQAESLPVCYERLQTFFISKIFLENPSSIIISHDFIMRIIELFFAKKSVSEITLSDLLTTQRNDYLCGFQVSKNGLTY